MDKRTTITIKKFDLRAIKAEDLARLSAILFFSFGLVRRAVRVFVSGDSLSMAVALGIVYLPLLIACAADRKKYIVNDFIALLSAILLFFAFSYLLHPEYEYYYKRSTYGVWPHVLIPYRGIYAYLFIRLINDPEKVKQDLTISGWLNLVSFLYEYYSAMKRGTWYGVVGQNAHVETDYSIRFGYEVLLFALLFLFLALREKKWKYIIPAIIDLALLLVAGSRGPVLFVGLFFVLYVYSQAGRSRNKSLYIVGLVLLFGIIYAVYDKALQWISSLLSRRVLSSRFLTYLINGNLSADSGRSLIWQEALQMIKERPWLGYGAMGSRHRISQLIVAGYPHNVFLELMIDFGVIVGGAISLVIIYQSFKMLFVQKEDPYRDLFLVFFCSACSLLVSLTFWSSPTLWICFALIVNSRELRKRRQRRK